MFAGDNNLTLEEDVEEKWFPGDEIVVATTSLDPKETEKFLITNVNGSVLTIQDQARFKHLGKGNI